MTSSESDTKPSQATAKPKVLPVVLVDYTGTDLVSGQLFESTNAKHAQEGNIFNPRITYKPVPIILGMHELIPALEKELEQMNEGETKTVQLEPKEGYGERNPDKIRILSLKDFREQKMNPVPGLIIEADGMQGKVQSVSGGRVRCDFNHPLAGKKIRYEITMRKKITEPKEKVSMLLAKFFPTTPVENITVKDNEAVIELPSELDSKPEAEILKKVFERMLKEHVGFSKVEFAKPKTEKKDTAEKDSKDEKTDSE
ncbi:MAG: peptidylprolyl isomerase [Candidatus Micrarchaeota archaeon]